MAITLSSANNARQREKGLTRPALIVYLAVRARTARLDREADFSRWATPKPFIGALIIRTSIRYACLCISGSRVETKWRSQHGGDDVFSSLASHCIYTLTLRKICTPPSEYGLFSMPRNNQIQQ